MPQRESMSGSAGVLRAAVGCLASPWLGPAGCLAWLVLTLLPCAGQNLVSNASFETGTSSPVPWLASGPSSWETFGRTGTRCASVNGEPAATYSWYAPLTIETGKSYWVRFWACATNSLGGYCFGGISTAIHDFTRPSEQWTDYAYATWVPDAGAPQFRMSSWDGSGPVYFDDAEVLPLNAVHTRVGNYDLGLGETLKAGLYQFTAQYTAFGGNCSRAIHGANTSFNTYRWYFDAGSQVTYRHELAGQPFTNAAIVCGILNYNNTPNTTLIVEASTDGAAWQPVGAMAQTTAATFSLPANLQPASVLFVRLRSTNAVQFSLASYSFSANVPDQSTDATGNTLYLGKLNPGEDVRVLDIQNTSTGRVATLAVPNAAFTAKQFECTAQTSAGTVVRELAVTTEVAAGATNVASLLVPTAGFGDNTVVLTVREVAANTVVFQQIHRFNVNILADDSFGERLPAPPACPVWWSSSAYKVGRTRGLPLATNTAVQVKAARNEYEAFQLVLRPDGTLSNLVVSVGNFISVSNPAIVLSGTNVTVERVDYVPVTVADAANFSSVLGDHPDPLLPITGPFNAPGGTNSPLWFTLHVPKDAPAGDYAATITIQYAGGSFTAPVRLHVFGFALTDVSHTRTAYGVIPQETWHGLDFNYSPEAVQVWELYMQNMARHRASPYYPQRYSPIQYAYVPGTDSFAYDFTAFDAAMDRYLEEYSFNGFRDINVFAELPDIEGVTRYNAERTDVTPEYRRLYIKLMQPILQHFRERGWMDLAYTQWIDEPAAADTTLVQQGMNMVEETAPDHHRRLATLIGPSPELFDYVNVWVPHWDNGMLFQYLQPRRDAGDELWYYVCLSPKDPWPNNLIDQPGINPRIRQWYAERMAFVGEEYWGINYYLGMTNPWTQTMTRGGTAATGFFNYGNGDGNLVYPPVKEKPTNTVVIAPPINSVRFETTRDGYEDREYFWLLKRVLAVAEPQLGTNHPAVIEGHAAATNAMTLLSWPPIYPYEPYRLEAARLRVANAIEGLETGAPFVAKHPLAKVVTNGAAQTLRVEAAGWPIPSIQWQHVGTNLPGATAARLVLSNINLSMAGDYRAILSNAVGTATSNPGKLTVLDASLPPQIIAQPVGVTRTNLGRAVLGVGASSVTPLTYQWLRAGVPIAGATNVTVVLSNLVGANSGFYSVIVSNAAGAVASAAVTVNVLPPEPPFILGQPTNRTVLVGQSALFAVTAGGAPTLSYQWQCNGTNLPSGGNSSSLTLANLQLTQAGSYRVIVTNVAGAVTSTVATLAVQAVPPSITSQPASLTLPSGGNAQFAVTAGGSAPLGYQWYFNVTNPLAGGVGAVLLITNVQPAQLGNYVVLVTNVAGAVTSTPALLQFYTMPNYTTEPPGVAGQRSNSNFILTLAPDNRNRTLFVSTNLLNWDFFSNAAPSELPVPIQMATTNMPRRFFRLQVAP